jgi:hypothetical protein
VIVRQSPIVVIDHKSCILAFPNIQMHVILVVQTILLYRSIS